MLTCCFNERGQLNNDEFERLAEQFHGMIISYTRKYYLPGGDSEDLYQWGLLGLYKAVLHFNETDRYSFEFVASVNIKNMMKSAITMANRKKHRVANEAKSLFEKCRYFDNEQEAPLIDRLVVHNGVRDPLDVVADKESVEKIYRFIARRLSDNERRVIGLYIHGYKQRHISGKLNVDQKVVDNAIQRARKKIGRYVNYYS
ncbi:rna polymerase sigma-70 region 2 [Lucifera butyrica]|uniref:Rna polymerase sigma-70 region 2 n=1 Tax=Lucifera butyrica TaxID=1351585 RepID=A0A498R9M8_9FIRM|nr:sigma-70 family RNA polymerase sigma factor [Lucifera butyrica]VBB06972.1 rna polymerase sigma-70 region 2 [Lucifera butyrica]